MSVLKLGTSFAVLALSATLLTPPSEAASPSTEHCYTQKSSVEELPPGTVFKLQRDIHFEATHPRPGIRTLVVNAPVMFVGDPKPHGFMCWLSEWSDLFDKLSSGMELKLVSYPTQTATEEHDRRGASALLGISYQLHFALTRGLELDCYYNFNRYYPGDSNVTGANGVIPDPDINLVQNMLFETIHIQTHSSVACQE